MDTDTIDTINVGDIWRLKKQPDAGVIITRVDCKSESVCTTHHLLPLKISKLKESYYKSEQQIGD